MRAKGSSALADEARAAAAIGRAMASLAEPAAESKPPPPPGERVRGSTSRPVAEEL